MFSGTSRTVWHVTLSRSPGRRPGPARPGRLEVQAADTVSGLSDRYIKLSTRQVEGKQGTSRRLD
eukprot:484896-Hanusia_phi.AAC.1